MPYVSGSIKEELKDRSPENGGELNYEITKILIDHWNRNKRYQNIHDLYKLVLFTLFEYKTSNVLLGISIEDAERDELVSHPTTLALNKLYETTPKMTVLDFKAALWAAFDEFKVRIVRPYENLKIEENGDVYL